MSTQKQYCVSGPCLEVPCTYTLFGFPLAQRSNLFDCQSFVYRKWIPARFMSTTSVELKLENDLVRFSLSKPIDSKVSSLEGKRQKIKRVKMSKKAKVNELKFYRLKARKKMNSPNPEVRIRYKLEKVGQLVKIQIYVCTQTPTYTDT